MSKFETAFAVTAWFETGDQPYTNPSGNFDGQGLSWGPRQNCIGQGSLQPLLKKMMQMYPTVVITAFGSAFKDLQAMMDAPTIVEQTKLAVSLANDEKGRLKPTWTRALASLGANTQIQQIFLDDAKGSIPSVDALASWIANGPVTLRTWCLAYDFVTQNGGFNSTFKIAISAFLLALSTFKKDPRDRMRAVCWLRAGWTYIRGQKQFAGDVLSRKLLIVEGSGKFRGSFEDLDKKFGISDEVVS